MRGFGEVRFLVSAASATQFPPDLGVEIAFAGRSNAGKSSAINALVARRALARISKTPGRTQLINFFALGSDRRLVDLPGYGYARVPQHERLKWPALIDALRARCSLRGVFLIVDARRGLTALDHGLIGWADPQVRRVHVLLSKADKLSRSEGQGVLRGAQRALAGSASAQLFSALSGVGQGEAAQLLAAWLEGRSGGNEGSGEGDPGFGA